MQQRIVEKVADQPFQQQRIAEYRTVPWTHQTHGNGTLFGTGLQTAHDPDQPGVQIEGAQLRPHHTDTQTGDIQQRIEHGLQQLG